MCGSISHVCHFWHHLRSVKLSILVVRMQIDLGEANSRHIAEKLALTSGTSLIGPGVEEIKMHEMKVKYSNYDELQPRTLDEVLPKDCRTKDAFA